MTPRTPAEALSEAARRELAMACETLLEACRLDPADTSRMFWGFALRLTDGLNLRGDEVSGIQNALVKAGERTEDSLR